MNTKKIIIISTVAVSLIVYNVLKVKKIGPCSPELEILINSK